MAIFKWITEQPIFDKEHQHRNTFQDYPESRLEVQVILSRGLIVSDADQFLNDAEVGFFGTKLDERSDAEFNRSLPDFSTK